MKHFLMWKSIGARLALCAMTSQIFIFGSQAHATDANACESLGPGAGIDKAVPDAATAKAVYLAILRANFPKQWRNRKPLDVRDMGNSWSVIQFLRPKTHEWRSADGALMETVDASAGGGGMEMIISKCDASVTLKLAR